MDFEEINYLHRRSFLHKTFLSMLPLALLLKDYMLIPKGIIIKIGRCSVDLTATRVIQLLAGRNAKVYADIDQQYELRKAGKEIPPMRFILFGNPLIGGEIIENSAVAALDLPLKLLIWEDRHGCVRIVWNDPGYLRKRYQLNYTLSGKLNLEPIVDQLLAG